jgi:hypothetical protein
MTTSLAQPNQRPPDPEIEPEIEPQIEPEIEVEVWCRSLRRWVVGFSTVDVDERGWRVRRRSDRADLPVRFPSSEIRPRT